MTFNEYWESHWKPTNQPAVFDLAMREIADAAWNAARADMREQCAALAEATAAGRDAEAIAEAIRSLP